MTIASFTLSLGQEGPSSPWLLMEARAAPVTALPTGVMFTLTARFIGCRIKWTSPGMTITDAHPAD